MRRVYLDSNVFISLFKRELGKGVRGLFVEAELFLDRVNAGGHILVLSELFFKEVARFCYLSKEEIIQYLEKKGIKTELATEVQRDFLQDFVKGKTHFLDSVHAAIAVYNKCDCIITFNVKDFEIFKPKIAVLEPGDFT